MLRYIFKRVVMLIPVLLGVSFLIFTMLYITPGDPARQVLGSEASPEAIKAYRDELGLNDPFFVRYGRYLLNAVQGDLGKSYTTKQPITKELMDRFPTTLIFAVTSTIIAIVIGIPLGILSATKQYSIVDKISTFIALFGVSMPTFWLGLLLILLFSLHLGWLPSSGFSGPKYWILPALTVGMSTAATIMRQTRSSMLEVIRQDYIRTARAKGQTEIKIVLKHALKNALIPIITVIGLQFGRSLGGTIVAEQIFSIPGLGKLMVDAIQSRNYPVVQGGVLFIAVAFSLVNLVVDVLYFIIDPRLKQNSISGQRKKNKTPAKMGGVQT